MRGRFRGRGWVVGVKRWGTALFPWSCGGFCGLAWYRIFGAKFGLPNTEFLYFSACRIPNLFFRRQVLF